MHVALHCTSGTFIIAGRGDNALWLRDGDDASDALDRYGCWIATGERARGPGRMTYLDTCISHFFTRIFIQ